MRLLVMMLCCSTVLLAAEEVELSKDAIKAKESYEMKVAEVVSEVKEDIIKEKENLIKSLEKELKTATKKGDLTGATAIQKRIDELNQQNNQANAGLFGGENVAADGAAPAASTIKILRAFLVQHGTQPVNVTEKIQALVNDGKTTIVGKTDLGLELDGQPTLIVEYDLDGSVYRKRLAWNFELKLDGR